MQRALEHQLQLHRAAAKAAPRLLHVLRWGQGQGQRPRRGRAGAAGRTKSISRCTAGIVGGRQALRRLGICSMQAASKQLQRQQLWRSPQPGERSVRSLPG